MQVVYQVFGVVGVLVDEFDVGVGWFVFGVVGNFESGCMFGDFGVDFIFEVWLVVY